MKTTHKQRTWSQVEEEFLLNNRNRMTLAQIARLVNHTERGTEMKYLRLLASQQAA